MARVLLLSPSPEENHNRFLPYALLFLRSALEKSGHQVALVDFQLGREAFRAYREELLRSPDVLGVSLFCGPAVPLAKTASRLCRKLSPQTRVVWGGIVPTFSPELVLEDSGVDLVVRYEAEDSFPRLVDAIAAGRPVAGLPNVAYRDERGCVAIPPPAELDDLGGFLPIDFRGADSQKYLLTRFHYGKRIVPLFTSRGCPYRCTFCYNHFYNRSRWRPFPVEWTLDTIDKLVEVFRIDGLMAFDDNIFVDRDRLRAILTGTSARGHDLKWWVELRVDQILEMSAAELSEFHRLGIEIAYVGVESGCDRVLKLLGKGITADDAREANRRLAATGISTCYTFIIGVPTERREETLQTVDLARELLEANPRAWLWQFNQYSPYPGTPLYRMAMRKGFRPYRTLEDWEVGWTFRNRNLSDATFSDAEMACIRYAGLFQKPDHFMRNRSFVYKTIFKTFRTVFAHRLRRHLFAPFADTWAIGRLYAAAEKRNRRYVKKYFKEIE